MLMSSLRHTTTIITFAIAHCINVMQLNLLHLASTSNWKERWKRCGVRWKKATLLVHFICTYVLLPPLNTYTSFNVCFSFSFRRNIFTFPPCTAAWYRCNFSWGNTPASMKCKLFHFSTPAAPFNVLPMFFCFVWITFQITILSKFLILLNEWKFLSFVANFSLDWHYYNTKENTNEHKIIFLLNWMLSFPVNAKQSL